VLKFLKIILNPIRLLNELPRDCAEGLNIRKTCVCTFVFVPSCINFHKYTLISDPSKTPQISFPDISKTIESYFFDENKAFERKSHSILQRISSWRHLFVLLRCHIFVSSFIISGKTTGGSIMHKWYCCASKNDCSSNHLKISEPFWEINF